MDELNNSTVKCEICGKEFEYLIGLIKHINMKHPPLIDYYHKYANPEKGVCKICGKDTKFLSFEKGYNKYCSTQCACLDPDYLKKRSESRKLNSNKENLVEEIKPIKCEICNKRFKNIIGLASHIAFHKIKKEDYYLKYIGEKTYCETCGKNTKFNTLKIGYSRFCSNKCSTNNSEVRKKYKETCIKNHGVDCCLKSKKIRDKSEETCLNKYGSRNASHVAEFKQKRKETLMRNFNVDCSFKSKKIRDKGEETCLERYGVRNAIQNKEIQNRQHETALRNNNGIHPSKLTYQKCLEKYPNVVKIEELIEGPNGEIMGHCKNSSCKNSKENGGYFEVTPHQINMRNIGINKHDTDNFYCCEECKQTCPLYGSSAATLHNRINENPEIPYTSAEYNTWKEEVYYRQKIENNTDTNFCEYCHITKNLHVHHEVPQKIVPGYALDPINGIISCEDCHYKYGHEKGTDCSTGNLANKICK